MLPRTRPGSETPDDSNRAVPLASERRVEIRHPVAGAEARLVFEGMHYVLRLKDLSIYGLCGLTDAPIAPGQFAAILFETEDPCESEIRWVRRTLIGVSFLRPLPLDIVHRMRVRHAALRRRAKSRRITGFH
ncbi:hypothetical protein [Allosphingosinicella deserti]|uniref:PilZ domain-containing protein n=1 Tax=Allosphingosinicella deserti TaxID=2116704 RepID=A0A2P7QNW3_9SPHN|nr:hypothetical protein [Sphingomonas deserti]PSJ39647.1 hypothetical protein C7I55_13710 [Sphingomonas deserti]